MFYLLMLLGRRPGFNPWVGKISWRREWLPTPVFLPGELHAQRSLLGYSSWNHKESDTTEIQIALFAFPRGSVGKESACNAGDPGLGGEDPLEKGMATHSSILAWRIPWTEESGGLQSTGLQKSQTD